jgi:hypothetical protein
MLIRSGNALEDPVSFGKIPLDQDSLPGLQVRSQGPPARVKALRKQGIDEPSVSLSLAQQEQHKIQLSKR